MNAAPNIIGGCYYDQQQRDRGVKHAMTSMTVNHCCLRTQQALLGKRAQEQDSQHGQMAATITTAVAPCLMPCLRFALTSIPALLGTTLMHHQH